MMPYISCHIVQRILTHSGQIDTLKLLKFLLRPKDIITQCYPVTVLQVIRKRNVEF